MRGDRLGGIGARHSQHLRRILLIVPKPRPELVAPGPPRSPVRRLFQPPQALLDEVKSFGDARELGIFVCCHGLVVLLGKIHTYLTTIAVARRTRFGAGLLARRRLSDERRRATCSPLCSRREDLVPTLRSRQLEGCDAAARG